MKVPRESTSLEYRQRICRVMNYISEHLDRDLTLDEIAGVSCFSKYHFHRIFKAVVGETVAGFTRRLRLEWAANRLLTNRREEITAVALDCGFSSSQNFSKAFRRRFGVSPSAFRNSKGGNTDGNGEHVNRNVENALSLRVRYDAGSLFDNLITDERSDAMNAEVRDMPEYHVAYVRKMGPYGKATCEEAFGELMRWAGPRGLAGSGAMLGVYWDNPDVTDPARCRTDACISVPEGTKPEGPVGIRTVSGGPHAVCSFEIAENGFQRAWEEAFEWLVRSGHECDDKPCYELYHNDAEEHPDGRWIFDICIPLKRA